MNLHVYKPKFIYAGIGSRQTPPAVQTRMASLTKLMTSHGGQCRSGNAEGADWACQHGVSEAIKEKNAKVESNQIFLPWSGFNANLPICYGEHYSTYTKEQLEKAVEIISVIHPAWKKLTQGAKKLHTRNVFQVCGLEVDDLVDFVLCWTPDGAEHHSRVTKDTGGTGTAIKIASLNEVPVYNLFNDDAIERLQAHLKSISNQGK